MIKLNLIAKGKEQELIKTYLEEHVSEILADKINNGTRIEKDGKVLINKKTLDGFMNFANEEARKVAEKGARSACVEDVTVYGWAIHYFEEDVIEGELFTENGEQYKPKKQSQVTKAPAKAQAPVAKKKDADDQMSFFDLSFNTETIDDKEEETEEAESVTVEDECEEDVEEVTVQEPLVEPEKPKMPPLFEKYKKYTDQYPTTLVAMRVGDFYEIFGEAAVLVSENTELKLVSRDFGFKKRTPMVGFPYHAEGKYRELIREFSSIAIINSDDDMHFYLKKEKDGPDMTVDTETGEIFEKKSSNVDDLIGILFGILTNDVEVQMK